MNGSSVRLIRATRFLYVLLSILVCTRKKIWNDSQIFSFAKKYIEKHNESPLIDLKEISGFAYFIRREAWDSLGGFDKNLPDYGNESELNIRLIKSGWRLVWIPKSYIHHFGRSSYKTSRRLKQDFVNSYIKDKHAG